MDIGRTEMQTYKCMYFSDFAGKKYMICISIHHTLTMPSLFQTITRKPCISLPRAHGFHMSRIRRDLVAPPDPVSHMRPVIYDDPPSKLVALRHPYSLSEFKDGNANDPGNYELQFHLLRQQLDSLHQNFWLDVGAQILLLCQVI